MSKIPCYQVDAFTGRRFAGNPAAVCPLDRFLPDEILQIIAAENALSETAFLVPRGDNYDLRWFTPRIEVDLCGHATLAAAFVLMTEIDPGRTRVTFHSRSGALEVTRDDQLFTLDFPLDDPAPVAAPPGLLEALGTGGSVFLGRYPLVVLDSAHAVRRVQPDFRALSALPDTKAVIVTGPGDGADADVDFVSRCFAPQAGIDEDPVTGSAHCILIPYWARRLDRTKLRARQVSPRGGELTCERLPNRVLIGGNAVLVKTGSMVLDDDER